MSLEEGAPTVADVVESRDLQRAVAPSHARRRSALLAGVAAAVVVVGVAVAAVAISGSSHPTADGGPASTEPVLGPIPTITSYTQVTLPIDEYLANAQQQTTLQRAAYGAESTCLQANGLAPVTVLLNTVPTPGALAAFNDLSYRDRVVRSDLWGFYDTQNYRLDGYRNPPGQVAGVGISFPLVPADVVAQCKADGAAALNALNAASADALPDGGPTSAATDSRYRAAVTAWSACMAGHGYKYANPIDAQNAGMADYTTNPTSTPAETALAIADIGCKNSTNLVGQAVAIQSAYDDIYIAAHRTELTASIDAVRQLVASTPSTVPAAH